MTWQSSTTCYFYHPGHPPLLAKVLILESHPCFNPNKPFFIKLSFDLREFSTCAHYTCRMFFDKQCLWSTMMWYVLSWIIPTPPTPPTPPTTTTTTTTIQQLLPQLLGQRQPLHVLPTHLCTTINAAGACKLCTHIQMIKNKKSETQVI